MSKSWFGSCFLPWFWKCHFYSLYMFLKPLASVLYLRSSLSGCTSMSISILVHSSDQEQALQVKLPPLLLPVPDHSLVPPPQTLGISTGTETGRVELENLSKFSWKFEHSLVTCHSSKCLLVSLRLFQELKGTHVVWNGNQGTCPGSHLYSVTSSQPCLWLVPCDLPGRNTGEWHFQEWHFLKQKAFLYSRS